ncbi:DNA polymerase epsilon catalytic subunit A [Phytophthora fragariae]|uniref:DNA polymerase epsilon catalytic subunit n=1 Tax=Phytophthora fragariae TaxID=53985 RepID=A0A6A4CRP2_9STRA|nr:DNA polymerase epsilon catalytic subunit A [Phytophthora fragariae]
MADQRQQYGGGISTRNPYGRGGGSAWARNSQGARTNAQRMRAGRGMTEAKQYALKKGDELDRKFGFHLLPELLEQEEEARKEQPQDPSAADTDHAKLGWLLNLRACTLPDPLEGKHEVTGLELYFLEQDGRAFKTRVIYQPYFYVRPETNRSQDVIAYCLRKFEGLVAKAERVFREDLDMADHLNGKKALYVKLSFATVSDQMAVKRELAPLVARNQERLQARQAYEMQGQAREQVTEDDLMFGGLDADGAKGAGTDESESALLELREYDVPYPMRVAIDLDIRVGAWYHVDYDPTAPYAPSDVRRQKDMVDKAEPVVCAFDIECTKAPLKFPDAQVDQIYMISYMIDRQGYLIVNREFVSEEIQDFEYTPKEAYPGPFIVFNEENEEQLLKRFFEHVIDEKPHIFVTYNGDFFDWPFIDARAQVHGINMAREIGISLDERSGEYRGRCSVHMDAFCWVKRDSYLPQGSQGLKAVTKYKLGYDPVEVDAEDMVALARDEPLKMASYSVSDAVATFYLYDKYVHLFVFSLCTIIPLGSEDVLRKGSGTLCEALLMVEAFEGNIICPNKQSSAHDEKFYKGHLVENETYVGGHVECLESGVFRADFLYDFQLVPSAFQQFIDNVDRDLRFSLEVEMNVPLDRVANYEEVKKDIVDQLVGLRERPNRKEQPLIYHLDVAAMYPNIILTNRLQPCAIVNEADCAACAYNTECGRAAIKDKDASCQREMDWVWRGDFYPATRPEYYSIKTQLEYENFPLEKKGGEANADAGKRTNGAGFTVPFAQLPNDKQEFLLKQRFKSYCSSVYKKTKVTEEQKRSATVCMRENPFYVNTVRAFRDRRYEYKGLTKVWKKKVSQAAEAKDLLAKIDAQNKCLVYDSLQLAHKCILNSFYGYVMRKGARWHSMEMAGIVTHMGSNIITGARELVEQIGRPLELDTDGIWAILPKSFPETFSFKLKDGGSRSISYPCVMLNADVHAKFTNPQYHELDPASGKYNTHKECSILFEVDGPYKAMVLPASTEEGKLLKKRYAVFNFDHSLAELKGFELKRRGELQLIKAFQSQVFECFLDGDSLEECYASVAKCANRWLDVIDTRGKSMDDEELMTLITENKSMSGKLDEYEGQKSTSITTARRLGEFLGEEMLKDKGLTCKMIIAARPYGEKVTERAIPTAIFATEDAVKKHFLKKWLKDPHLQDFDIRSILDWDYYRTRFASTVQKIISLPAAFQNVRNPVPRIELPDWMRKQVREKNAKHQQGNMKQFFKAAEKGADNGDYVAQLIDMEDLIKGKQPSRTVNFQPRKRGNKASNDTGGSSPIEEIDDDDIEHVPAAKVKLGEVPFTDWLKNRKKKWKSMLGKRRREREERMRNFSGAGGFGMANSAHGSAKRFQSGTTSVLASKGNGVGMENFVFNAGSALQREYWQIVEIQQEQGGIFTCWVLTAHSRMLQRITLKMPRVFYITCQEDDQDTLLSLLPGSRRVSRIVPHYSSKPQSVLEVMLSERQYQQYHKEISQILGDPHVEGVYELQVSALTRAVCALGCVAKVVNPHLSSTKQEYELTDLQFQSTAQAPYLMDPQRSLANEVGPAPPNSLMRRVLLYFAQQKKRAILGLVVLKEEDDDVSAESSGTSISEGDANVWYVDPFSNVKSRGSDLRQFFDQLLLESQEEGGTTPIQSCSFKTHVVKTAAEAFSGVNATLARLASNKQLAPKPTIVVAQTCIPSSKRLREKMQGLHSFPIAMLPWNEEDTLFPALTWRKLMGEKMLTRCFEMTQYYSDVLDCARYAHLPVGNFTGDHSIAILDTLYSRILTKHKHLWWHSPTSLPDLGGKEQEQQFQQLFSQSLLGSAQQSSKKKGDAVSQHRVDTSVVVCEKGAFVDVCVELELDGLAVNAILVASQIHSIEGLGVAHQMEIDFEGNGESESNSKGDSAAAAVAEGDAEESCHEAFRLLRVMVTTLFKDFLANRNKFADHVLQQFYRWLCSPNSLSFDPALHAMVKRLMEKLFLQLLAEFRRLGSQIVYADFSKIIVCTKKKSVRDAQTYLNFILQTVLSNELFQVLNFTPKKYFSNLFFLDAENYGCILLKNVVPEEDEEEESDHDVDGSDQKPLEIVSHWNIANYLPRGVDEYFLILVGQFIRRRAEFQLRERRRLSKGGDAKADVVEDVEDQPLDEDEKQLSPLAKYSQRLVSSYFSDKMLRLVPEILTYNMDRDSFPVFAGSHLSMESPALELVKCVSAVFLLEPSVEAQVGKMKRTLLKLLRMSEFADESQFRNPSLSFTVQDVICLCCNLCRSVDLCRDPQLFKGSASRSDEDDERQEGEDAEATTAWHCPRCFALYDKTAFEMRLVEMVQAQSVAYQLQDLYCSKCLLPAEHKMREYCPCSGTYALMPGVRESLIETLRLLNRIAQQHNFEWLLETVQRLEREAAQPLLIDEASETDGNTREGSSFGSIS